MENLSNLLEKHRKSLMLTQDQFAQLLGITQQAYGKWEAGVSTPRPQYMESIAKLLQISIEDAVSAKIAQQHLIQLARSKKNDHPIVSLDNIEVKKSYQSRRQQALTGYGLIAILASSLENKTLEQHQINTLGSLVDSFVLSSVK